MIQNSPPQPPIRILRPLVFERRIQLGLTGHATIATLLWLITWFALGCLEHRAGTVEVELETQIPHVNHARLYYDAGRGINPTDSVSAWIRPGSNLLRFNLPPGEYTRFRLDPTPGPSGARIDSITIHASRHGPAQPIALTQVRAGEQIAELAPANGGLTMTPVADAAQPQLLIEPESPLVITEAPRSPFVLAASAAVLVLALFAIWHGLIAPAWSWSVGVALGILIALLLAWTMAFESPSVGAIHPDEIAHVWSFQYYLDRVLPTSVEDPALARSISIYGFSYLFELDVVYALAARTVGPFANWFANDTILARCFNLALLAIIAALALRSRRNALVLSVFLLSPQIWYVFSYFNADAFPLTISLIAACLVADEDSGLNRYLDGRDRANWGLLCFALAIGMLLVSKRNYLPVVAIFGLWLTVRHLDLGWRRLLAMLAGLLLMGSAVHLQALPGWLETYRAPLLGSTGALMVMATMGLLFRHSWQMASARPVFLRLAAAFGLALAIAAPRVLIDVAINGSPGTKAEALTQIAESHAGHGFKPSQLNQDFAYHGRAIATRGTTFGEVLFSPHHWITNSIDSAFGIYGYFVASSPAWLLITLQLLWGCVAVSAGMGVWKSQPQYAGRLLLIVLGGAAMVMMNSALHSWTFDLQRQGRYLFPIFIFLSLLVGSVRDQTSRRALGILFAIATLLSAISFIGTALPALMATD